MGATAAVVAALARPGAKRSCGVAALPVRGRGAASARGASASSVGRVPGDLSAFLARVAALRGEGRGTAQEPGLRDAAPGELLRALPGVSAASSQPRAALPEHVGLGRAAQSARPCATGLAVEAADVENFRCAPGGLLAALREALGLPAAATPQQVLRAVPQIGHRAERLAGEVLACGLGRVVGPGGLLAADWLGASEAQVQAQLARMFGSYMQELVDIIGVSTAFNQLTMPVAHWRRPHADLVINDGHVRSLWGKPDQLPGMGPEVPWSKLGAGFSLLDGAVSSELALRAREELEALEAAGALTDFSTSTCNPGSRHLWLRCHSQEERHQTPPALLQLSDFLGGLPGALEAVAKEVEAISPGSLQVPRLRLMPGMMAAKYGPGSHYVPHLDMYSSGSHGFMNSRLLTVICYLNPGWRPGSGGELRLFRSRPRAQLAGRPPAAGAQLPSLLGIRADHSEATSAMEHDPDGFTDIAPLLGRVVMFRSRDLWHGIQELSYERWAVTVWLLADTT